MNENQLYLLDEASHWVNGSGSLKSSLPKNITAKIFCSGRIRN